MTAPVQPGDLLAGKYRVEKVLGVGGMGVVVSASHLQLDQLVALKFMLPEVLGNADAVTRFLREARAVVRLKGEHVARVLDVGTLDNGAPYIVMEYLEGNDLAGILDKRGSLPVGEACAYVLQACEAMAEAHAQAIVHRDLKPQNLFLTRSPDGTSFVKVLDFGISKAGFADAEQGFQATRTAAIMGSPAYMSPEQMKSSKDVDARTDIWALGVILYQLVSGRLPFVADTMAELCVQVLAHEPTPLCAVRPDVPPAFEAAVERCLVKDRNHRYANISELVADLVPFVPRTGAATLERVSQILKIAPRFTPPMVRPSESDAAPYSSKPLGNFLGTATTLGGAAGVSQSDVRPTGRLPAALMIAAGIAIVGLIVFAITRSADQPPTTPTVQPAAAPLVNASAKNQAAVALVVDAGSTATAGLPEIDAGVRPTTVTTEPKSSRRIRGGAKKPPVTAEPPKADPLIVLEPKKPDPVPQPVKPDPRPEAEPTKPDPDPYRNRH